MGNIGEGSSMNKSRRVLRRLYKIRSESITQQDSDSTRHAKVFYTKMFTFGSDAQYDILDAALQVFFTGCQAEDSHQF